MPKPTGLSSDAEAQERADAAVGDEIYRKDTPKPKAKPKAQPKSPDRPYMPVSPDRPYKKMASGGYVSKADGCTQSGKTKGRFV